MRHRECFHVALLDSLHTPTTIYTCPFYTCLGSRVCMYIFVSTLKNNSPPPLVD